MTFTFNEIVGYPEFFAKLSNLRLSLLNGSAIKLKASVALNSRQPYFTYTYVDRRIELHE